MERESESGGKVSDLDAYEIEGGETKSEILQNLAEFQFSCVSPFLWGWLWCKWMGIKSNSNPKISLLVSSLKELSSEEQC